jgi:hypothetical protein
MTATGITGNATGTATVIITVLTDGSALKTKMETCTADTAKSAPSYDMALFGHGATFCLSL